jgi:hypothetical protein
MGPVSGHGSILRVFFFTLLVALGALAQQPKVLAPHKLVMPKITPNPNWRFPAPTQRSMVGGPWMIDANFKSTVYLKNDVRNAAITATPIIYLSNGKRYALPDVKLGPAGIAVINVNDELSKQGVASWANLSGYVEIDYMWAWDALCVTVQDVDTAHSLIFTYGFHPGPSGTQSSSENAQQNQTLEGMWWKQESNVAGFVTLSNMLPQAVSAKLRVSDNKGTSLGQHSVVISPHGTKLVRLNEMQFGASAEGSLTVNYSGPEGGLIVNGGLKDPNTGYSANLHFWTPPSPGTKSPTGAYGELGLMAGAADPMMSFPARTVFTPYSIVRNATDQPIGITPVLWWMEAGAPRSARLKRLTLLPQVTQRLPVEAMLVQAGLANFNGSFNLILEADTKPRELLMASGSVDQTNTYVFEVPAQGIAESASKSLSYWSTGKGDDTMITLWNPADEAQDFVFTLFFTGGSYKYPVSLAPRATRNFNISEIIHSQVPDVDGNVIPPTVHEGNAQIAGARDESEHILIGMAAGTYNVQKATCGYYCLTCDGFTGGYAVFDPFAVGVGATTQEHHILHRNTGSTYDASSVSNWSSSNNSIASVANPGNVNGVSVGTFTVTAVTTEDEPIYDPYHCNPDPTCLPPREFSSTGGGTTTPLITSIDPNPVMIGSTNQTVTIEGSGFGTSPTVNLPSGLTSGGQGSTDTKIVLTGVSVANSATVGNTNVTVTADGQTSPPATLTVDGPYQMVVQSDVLGKCTGCQTTVLRTVTYQVQNFSGTLANTTWVGENVSLSGWSCTQSNPGSQTAPCSANFMTNSAGVFSDQWSLASDGYTPTGCGQNVTDHWQWCAHSPAQTLGTLTGYVHTNAISINGVVSPPNSMPPGTVIPF